MEPARLLNNMCHEALVTADINAIRKSRGFSAEETSSRSLLENFYLTDIGLDSAMSSLTENEVSALYLLQMVGKPVQVSFFERVYSDRDVNTSSYLYHRTFSQRYQDVFKQVRTKLVRRGLLVMAEAGREDTKLERWRFHLPVEFTSHLPPLFPNVVTFDQAGTTNNDVVGKALRESHRSQDSKNAIRLSSGSLLIGTHSFTAHRFHRWLQSKWKADLGLGPRSNEYLPSGSASDETSPVDALHYMLAQLGENEWVTPEQIAPGLYIFSGDRPRYSNREYPSAEEMCRAGWQWGQLTRASDNNRIFYRLAPSNISSDAKDDNPAAYLKVSSDNRVRINLRNITNENLELMTHSSNLSLENERLVAEPNLIKLGKMPVDLRNRPIIQWLSKESSIYQDALSTVEKQWGKQILHTNLLVAKINDLTLKVAIEKAFAKSNELQFLPNDYVAFPQDALAKVERAVKKAGHVVKTVEAGE